MPILPHDRKPIKLPTFLFNTVDFLPVVILRSR